MKGANVSASLPHAEASAQSFSYKLCFLPLPLLQCYLAYNLATPHLQLAFQQAQLACRCLLLLHQLLLQLAHACCTGLAGSPAKGVAIHQRGRGQQENVLTAVVHSRNELWGNSEHAHTEPAQLAHTTAAPDPLDYAQALMLALQLPDLPLMLLFLERQRFLLPFQLCLQLPELVLVVSGTA